ncbi:hypothetical protein [Parasulfitobacter algicola]|uniref:Uncharacterized protein n=1 Tax=Parasulfitobacter algicola TaxID=2614809 RepID=A0ABX2IRA0_9RHOB|nr:hypothetical protein [Sulfitobacter algicola]NSX53620.1 hypothetical protein [Sulfitobacter algicola]
MSAPNTNIEKQEKRHSGSLIGIAVVVVFALILLAALLGWTFYSGQEASLAGIE